MLKKTIAYKDFTDANCTEDFYFNLTKAELIDMQLSEDEGFDAYIKAVVKAGNNKALFNAFKQIILKSYGVRSEDGRRFIKSQAISEEFATTGAYDALITELVLSDSAAVDFINALVPQELIAQTMTPTADVVASDPANIILP